jgi:hypothetical protein
MNRSQVGFSGVAIAQPPPARSQPLGLRKPLRSSLVLCGWDARPQLRRSPSPAVLNDVFEENGDRKGRRNADAYDRKRDITCSLRLARWLLMCHDRVRNDELPLPREGRQGDQDLHGRAARRQ